MGDLAAFAELAALVLGPVAAVAWPAVRAPLRRRTALGLAGVAAGAVGLLLLTPVSLAGTAADEVALVAAYVGLCFAALAAVRRRVVRAVAGVVWVAAAIAPGVFVVVLGAPPRLVLTERLPCGHVLRVEAVDWYGAEGEIVTVLWQPRPSPVEVERASTRFYYGLGAPWYTGRHAFRGVPRGRCGVDVAYGDRVVWRAR